MAFNVDPGAKINQPTFYGMDASGGRCLLNSPPVFLSRGFTAAVSILCEDAELSVVNSFAQVNKHSRFPHAYISSGEVLSTGQLSSLCVCGFFFKTMHSRQNLFNLIL